MKNTILLTALVALILSGCAAKVYTLQTPFDERQFAPYAGVGTSSVQGQAFLKTRGGEVRYAAGNTVTLNTLAGLSVSPDPRWGHYIRHSIADGFGHFQFDNIPAGTYFLECPVFWEVPGPYGLYRTGSWLRMDITVVPGQTLKVVMAQ